MRYRSRKKQTNEQILKQSTVVFIIVTECRGLHCG